MDKIFIAIPAFHSIHDRTNKSLTDLINNTSKCKIAHTQVLYNQSCIPFARNMLVDYFMESTCDYLFFIDADICILRPEDVDAIDRLYSHEKDIIGGVYPCKNPPFNPAIMSFSRWEKGGKGFFEDFSKYPNPLEVKYCATGFLLIRRAVFDTVGKNPFNLRYYKDNAYEGYQMPEDYSFCDLAGDHSIKSFVDHSILLGHIGEYHYSMLDFYTFCKSRNIKEGKII